jgi:2-iminobutanoate/2-iminopropanoate deaminase
MENVVKTTVFLRDLEDFPAMNRVFGEFFSGVYPARSTVQAAGLPKGALVEIEAIALMA